MHLFISLDLLSFCWLTHIAKAWQDTWSLDGLWGAVFSINVCHVKSVWICYLFVLCNSKSSYQCLIKCGIIFPLLLIRFLAAESGSGCRGGWVQWPDGWKIVENLIWTMVIHNVIILPGSWVKTRGYDSEISICLNVCCKNWIFFFWNHYIYTTCPLVTSYILLSLHILFSSFDLRKIPK